MREEMKVNVRGTQYTVREISVEAGLPLLDGLADEDDGEGSSRKGQLAICNACVFDAAGKEPIDVGQLGLNAYMELLPAVMEINGLAAGKDSALTSEPVTP